MSFEEIEKVLLIAPLRCFKDWDVRGHFSSELKDLHGVSEKQIKRMLSMRSTFRWSYRVLKGEREFFFTLK